MTGSSLWLLPPPSHPLSSILKELITAKIPSHFPHLTASQSLPPSFFEAHMTLTSEIPPSAYGSNPQAWLDSIPFPPAEQVKLRFGRIKSQDVFHRRCFVSVEYDGVKEVVAKAREHGVEGAGEEDKVDKWLEWWKNEYGAHVSLIYGDEKITEGIMKEIESVVQNAGVKLPEIDDKKGEWDGWEGGVVWLVPTDGPIKDWKPIAMRQL